MLLRPLPYPDPNRLAMVWMTNSRINLLEDWHSFPDYWDYRAQNTTFDDLAIFNDTSRTLTGEGNPDAPRGAYSSANLFDVLGVRADPRPASTRRRKIGPAPTRSSCCRTASGSGASAAATTRSDSAVQMNGLSVRIIGVMPPGFAFPTRETEFWVPMRASDAQRQNRGSLWLQVIGRIKAGVSVAQAQADLERVNAGILERFPAAEGLRRLRQRTIATRSSADVRPAILVLVGAVGFVLLIACTNVANLLLSRSATRERELALRAAIGAGRGRLVRQLLTESVLLGAIGGAVGLGLAWIGLRAILGSAPPDLPRLDAIALDGRVLAFTVVLSLVTGLLFRSGSGAAAGAHQSGRDAEGRRARVIGPRAIAPARPRRARDGAGGRAARRRRPDAAQLRPACSASTSASAPIICFTARVGLWGDRYRPPQARVDFFAQVIERTRRSVRESRGAAGIGTVFLSATPNSTNFSIEGRGDFAPEDAVEVPVDCRHAGLLPRDGHPPAQGPAVRRPRYAPSILPPPPPGAQPRRRRHLRRRRRHHQRDDGEDVLEGRGSRLAGGSSTASRAHRDPG